MKFVIYIILLISPLPGPGPYPPVNKSHRPFWGHFVPTKDVPRPLSYLSNYTTTSILDLNIGGMAAPPQHKPKGAQYAILLAGDQGLLLLSTFALFTTLCLTSIESALL